MIRIDEIYKNTFWPWLNKNKPGAMMMFCDPPGRTDPDALFNYAPTTQQQTDYVFFHDQEPIQNELFKELFNRVFLENLSIGRKKSSNIYAPEIVWPDELTRTTFNQHLRTTNHFGSFFDQRPALLQNFIRSNSTIFNRIGHVIVSELGENADQLAETYQWKKHYYFYHGWACQDWFRGYDKTFLIPRARDRRPTRTFISPNRIVAGQRDHRMLFLYNIFKNQLEHNHISAPRICPEENVDITSIAQKYINVYQDITEVFKHAKLPRLFAGEETQNMASCWLTNFDESADSLVYVPTETVYFGRRLHLTEKTFKAIALEMPFVLMAPAHSLEYLRSYGFQTFAGIFDESYDEEVNDITRVEKVVCLLKQLDNLSQQERQSIHRACLSVVEHNYNHFYRGGFENILWKELTNMLKGLLP
jgi:hypothetical protein